MYYGLLRASHNFIFRLEVFLRFTVSGRVKKHLCIGQAGGFLATNIQQLLVFQYHLAKQLFSDSSTSLLIVHN